MWQVLIGQIIFCLLQYDSFIFTISVTQVVYKRYPNRIRDKYNWWIVVPNKPSYKVNNKFTLLVAFREKDVFHVLSVNDTIPLTLLNEEEDMERFMKMM